jgi:hypothetical protein
MRTLHKFTSFRIPTHKPGKFAPLDFLPVESECGMTVLPFAFKMHTHHPLKILLPDVFAQAPLHKFVFKLFFTADEISMDVENGLWNIWREIQVFQGFQSHHLSLS